MVILYKGSFDYYWKVKVGILSGDKVILKYRKFYFKFLKVNIGEKDSKR